MANVDSIIERLMAAKNTRPGTPVQLQEREAAVLVAAAEEAVSRSPMLLELEAPLQIVGDIHGQFVDLLRLFEFKGLPPNASYLFLGDYVDRGPSGLECMFLLMALKVKHPDHIHLLRGNHECAAINRIYGFYDECKKRYSIKLWKSFQDLFNALPLAAVVEKRIFCIHGGLSPDMESPDDIKKFHRPVEVPDTGLLCDTLWSDPDKDITGWAENDRGVSFTFGADVVSKFLERNDLDLIVRAHQVVEDGYEFFGDRTLVTVRAGSRRMPRASVRALPVSALPARVPARAHEGCEMDYAWPTCTVRTHPIDSRADLRRRRPRLRRPHHLFAC